MLPSIVSEKHKKARYVYSFLKKKLVHTNLQLLYECNFRCTICDFWKERYKQSPRLSLSDIEIISQKLQTIGPQIISIGGGEPLLHPDIVPIVKTLAKRHFPVMICNGWYVEPALAKELFKVGIYEVSISVDYKTPQKHDNQRGREGAFERAIKALQVLNESRVSAHQRVHMISVVMEDNVEDIEPLIQLCRKIGITYLLTLYSDSRGAKQNRGPGRDRDVTNHLLKLKRKYKEFVALRGYVSHFSTAVKNGGIDPCYAGKNLCNIDSQGDVSLCIDRLETVVGNILTDNMVDLEDRLLSSHQNNSCKECWTSCRGSIETLMYGKNIAANLFDYYTMTRRVGLKKSH